MSEPAVEDALRIDDLTFTDLLRLALEEIPAASGGRWTLHGPVDPGITLIERFAWELEQRLFSAEQITPETVQASLRLLGAGGPASTQCARTVLCLAGTTPPAEVPAGSVFRLDGDRLDRPFALTAPVTTVPLDVEAVMGRLQHRGDQLDIVVSTGGTRVDEARLSLLVLLAAAPGVEPGWSAAAAAQVPPAALLRWTAVGPDGAETVVAVDDTTGGLRRSGLLALDWPRGWNALGGGGCRLRVTVLEGRFTEPVRITAVHPNAAPAEHRVTGRTDLTDQVRALLPLPSGRVRLHATAGRLVEGPGDVAVDIVEQDGTTQRWTSVGGWTGIGPGDRVFVADRARGELTFGDGRAGRIPRLGTGGTAVADHATGGGESGNLGAGGSWVREDGPQTAISPVAAAGGREAESLADARLRMADERNAPDRAVTTDDAERLALATPGVGLQRAHASLGLHPDFSCLTLPSVISVTVVPDADRSGDASTWTIDPIPDDGVLAAVRAHLATGRLVGQELFVLAPVYRRVAVRVTISQSALSSTLEPRVAEVLRRHLDPLRGGSDGQGWSFGAPVRPSSLIEVVSAALGPESTVTALTVALDDGPISSCDELVIGERELIQLASLHVTWVSGTPTGGGLR